MAILFDCPYCTAPIKVADAAAGKVGRCPKCETKLTVPIPAKRPVAAKPPQVTGDIGSVSTPASQAPTAEQPAGSAATGAGPKSAPSLPVGPPNESFAPVQSSSTPAETESPIESTIEPTVEPAFIPAPGSFLKSRGHHASVNPSAAADEESPDFNFLDTPTSPRADGSTSPPLFTEAEDAISQFPVVQELNVGGFPAVSTSSPNDPAAASFAARVKSQRKVGWGRLLIPLFLGIGLLAAGGVTYFATRTTFTGELTSELVLEDVPFMVEIDRTRFALPAARVEQMLAEFRNEPRELKKNLGLMDFGAVRFEGQEQGLVITQFPGPDAQVVRVDLRSNAPFMEYVKEHAARLDEPRQRIIRQGVEKFARDWDAANAAGMGMGNLGDFQESLGREAMAGSIGHHVIARVGSDSYQCAFQDAEARLYFLLPNNVTAFDLVERAAVAGGDLVFEKKFEFHVTIVDPSKVTPTADPAAPAPVAGPENEVTDPATPSTGAPPAMNGDMQPAPATEE